MLTESITGPLFCADATTVKATAAMIATANRVLDMSLPVARFGFNLPSVARKLNNVDRQLQLPVKRLSARPDSECTRYASKDLQSLNGRFGESTPSARMSTSGRLPTDSRVLPVLNLNGVKNPIVPGGWQRQVHNTSRNVLPAELNCPYRDKSGLRKCTT
jgi:hypothetical protein